jgi:MFS family permease
MHTVSLSASMHHFLALYGHSTGAMAAHYGSIVSMNNLLNAFLGPIAGSLSDQFGRVRILAAGRLGWCLWWGLLPLTRTPLQRLLCEGLCWGVLQAGNWTVFSAAYSDRFAERPSLFAQINAADQAHTVTRTPPGIKNNCAIEEEVRDFDERPALHHCARCSETLAT